MTSLHSNESETYQKYGYKIDNFSSDFNTSNQQIEVPTQKLGEDETSGASNLTVGALAVAGIGRRMDDVEETSFPYDPSKDQTSVVIMNARLVEDDIVNAVPLEGPSPKSVMKYRLLFILSSILLVGIICLVVLFLTRRLSSDPRLNPASSLFLEALKPLLTNKSLHDLETSESVPSLALYWLLEKSNFDAYSIDRQIQRFALAAFYYATEGRSWNQSKGWLTDIDECTWYQDNNEDLCVNGTLRVLSLQSNNLAGLLPNEIALFSSLEILNLAFNRLTGSIPMEVQNLSSLIHLHLQSNFIEGSIPIEIEALKNLQELELHWNNISGEIPSEIGECTELILINLGFNRINGSIPSEIGQCTNLSTLYLNNNILHGSISSEIGALRELEDLIIYNNTLSGTIPSEIGMLTNLKQLLLYINTLGGTIPSEIGQCTKLVLMDLGVNDLGGSIPSEVGQCTSLSTLALSINTLHGSLPSEIGALTKLENLWIYNNTLDGTIPSEMG
jgi:Leucine-rich repeat (LRR) protein